MKQNSAKSSCLAAENKINPLYQRKWFDAIIKTRQGILFLALFYNIFIHCFLLRFRKVQN